jgi:predicted nucleic acid-binding protein
LVVRIYLDACTINRLTDDQSQARVVAEAEALTRILDLISAEQAIWIASPAVYSELARNPDEAKRDTALAALSFASELIHPSLSTTRLTAQLRAAGFGAFDALHLALATEAGATALLTVDDRFIRRSSRLRSGLTPAVLNPIDWLNRRPR